MDEEKRKQITYLIIEFSAFMMMLVLAMLFSYLFSAYIIEFTKALYPELGTMKVSNASQMIKGAAAFLITVCIVLVRSYKNIRSTELISQLSEVQ